MFKENAGRQNIKTPNRILIRFFILVSPETVAVFAIALCTFDLPLIHHVEDRCKE
jgi:hypothetical protein